jgi:hypothetical protein
LLIRAGLVRPDQLAEAQKLRARSGGTTGEWLVRLGAVTEEQLVDFYHRRLLVPRIQPPQLARVPGNVLLAVPAEMASEFLVFPVSIDPDGALSLAMADPADTHVAEEVAFYSGRVCLRAVAAASAIRDAIEKNYRQRGFGLPLVSPLEVRAVLPEPSVPHRVLDPVTQPIRITLSGLPPLDPAEEPVLLTNAKGDAGTAAAGPAQSATPGTPRQRSITQPRATRSPEPPSPPPTPMPPSPSRPHVVEQPRRKTLPGLPVVPELPTEALRQAQNRDEVAALLLDYAAALAPIAAMLVIRRGTLVGHGARGASVQEERFRHLVIPLDEPSLFRDVAQSQLPFRGPLPDAPAHRAIVGTLGRHPGDVLIVPIAVGGKAIAILYAAGIEAPLPEAALQELALEAGDAYERLIRSRKA